MDNPIDWDRPIESDEGTPKSLLAFPPVMDGFGKPMRWIQEVDGEDGWDGYHVRDDGSVIFDYDKWRPGIRNRVE